MPAAAVVAVTDGSPAHRAGVQVGDELVAVAGEPLRDIIQYRVRTDQPTVTLDVRRGGTELSLPVTRAAGQPLGLELDGALYDRVRTCDNHCSFCFIHQLPKGLRRTLYLKDDDYRLSFLYGNFTTLTRFTEADLERVLGEGLAPLYVSIHATDPEVRAALLRNRRGAVSLRWLRALLDHGVQVFGQVVVCPGSNDGPVLEETLCGVLEQYPELAALAVVPLGVSAHNTEPDLRPHTAGEAGAVLDLVEEWQGIYLDVLGRRLVHAADEYYLLAGRPFPSLDDQLGGALHEDGIGMARTFAEDFARRRATPTRPRAGFFAWAEGVADPAPPRPAGRASAGNPTGYTVAAGCGGGAVATPVRLRARRGTPIGVLTGAYGASVLAPLVAQLRRPDVRLIPVENRFFGGNIGVTGLLVGADLARVLAVEPPGQRYLLPDVCLSEGRFLDGTTLADLPRPVEVVPTDGASLRTALER